MSFIVKEDDGMDRRVLFGNYFHCLSFNESESVLNGFMAVEDGKVSINIKLSFNVISNLIRQFIKLIDCRTWFEIWLRFLGPSKQSGFWRSSSQRHSVPYSRFYWHSHSCLTSPQHWFGSWQASVRLAQYLHISNGVSIQGWSVRRACL